MIEFFLSLVGGLIGALLGCRWYSRKKWQLILNEKTRTLEIIQESDGKVEYLSEPTAQELEEINNPLNKFLSQFKIKRQI